MNPNSDVRSLITMAKREPARTPEATEARNRVEPLPPAPDGTPHRRQQHEPEEARRDEIDQNNHPIVGIAE
jgi:hypothetical protein